jgi:hypothetical protein
MSNSKKPAAVLHSVLDRKIELAKSMVEESQNVHNVIGVINEVIDVLDECVDKPISTRKNIESRKKLRLSIDSLKLTAHDVSACALKLAPIAQMGYACKRSLMKNKRENCIMGKMTTQKVGRACKETRNKSIALASVEEHVHSCTTQQKKLRVNPPEKKIFSPATSPVNTPPATTTALLTEEQLLHSREMYTPLQAYDIVSRSKNKAEAIRQMIDMGKIPVSITQMYRITYQDRASIRPWWNDRGCRAILNDEEIKETIKENMSDHLCMSFGRAEMKTTLENARKKHQEAEGYVALDIAVSQKTVKNYSAYIATMPSTTTSNKVMDKTNRRYTADHSLNNAVTFLSVIAANHYFVGKKCLPELFERMSDGAKEMIRLVSKANQDQSVCPLKPQYIFSTDDTVTYVYQGIHKRWAKEHFVSAIGSNSLKEKN